MVIDRIAKKYPTADGINENFKIIDFLLVSAKP